MNFKEAIRASQGRKVTMDAAVLLEFVDASKQLYLLGISPRTCSLQEWDRATERWELANATLCGSIDDGR